MAISALTAPLQFELFFLPFLPLGLAVTRYRVDEGPPIRVAFPWPGSLLDNWCGAVYDPTGAGLKVNELHAFSGAWENAPVANLFGGAMTSCRKLSGPYYHCCFR